MGVGQRPSPTPSCYRDALSDVSLHLQHFATVTHFGDIAREVLCIGMYWDLPQVQQIMTMSNVNILTMLVVCSFSTRMAVLGKALFIRAVEKFSLKYLLFFSLVVTESPTFCFTGKCQEAGWFLFKGKHEKMWKSPFIELWGWWNFRQKLSPFWGGEGGNLIWIQKNLVCVQERGMWTVWFIMHCMYQFGPVFWGPTPKRRGRV